MAQFNINQTDNKLTILPTGEATRATVYERKNDEFINTGVDKSIDGVPVWNQPAVLLQEGTSRPLANKIVIVSETQPAVQIHVPVQAENLTLDTNGRFQATDIKSANAGFAMPKSGDAK